jgi:hypothetical protein
MFFEEKYKKPKLKKKRHSRLAIDRYVFPEDAGDLCLFQFALRFPRSHKRPEANAPFQYLKKR